MNSQARDLAAALRERLEIIRDEESRRDPTSHLQRLKSVTGRIEQLEANLPQPVPAQLAHFLQRRSYDKALAFIESDL